jgi:hypothetical protein
MSNRNFGFPEGFEGDLVKQEFKATKPIFWGPNHKTKYPDSYEEPSDWKQPDLMIIPPVIRIITGGKFVNTSVSRSIYLGYQQEATVGAHNFDSGAFIVRNDITTLYAANQSTLTVAGYSAPYIGWFSGTQRWYFFLFNNILGDISTQTNTLQWFRSDVDVDATGTVPGLGHIFFDNFVPNLTADHGLLLQP